MLNCRDASRLTVLACDRELTAGERLRLGLHRLFCAPCRLYRRQVALLRARLRELDASPADARLDAAAGARIRARLRAASGQPPD